ncbi:Ig-like domain-containing protein [Flammeovirga aprica]|uniref:T9SS type A sorting domain-containing protein n=1 Tax=Flammeovirga aprica JL-4 TaxID=694437 RepID=A0A7X9P1P4_9BACT|nr:Ig-like domain-containing protein [Flammeovirga aprica]NME67795.1 T9SS type A sorting domain-containing protein [Flammeovirga aprica JL-4]
MRSTKFTILTLLLICVSNFGFSQKNIHYGEDFIAFEAEDTDSPLGKWKLRTPEDPLYYKGDGIEALNQTYIEFTGAWASKESPLTYKFTCKKSGDYRMLMRLYQPLTEDEKGDQKNDMFVRLEGNYTSATTKPKSELEKDHKFWGRGVRVWGTCHSLEIGSHAHATYGLIEGEEYTLVMSGRSAGASIDYILFYLDNPPKAIGNQDLALQFPEEYRPFVTPTGISILPADITKVRKGASLQFDVDLQPVNTQKEVTWVSSDEAVLTVENGNVTAVGEVGASATITVTTTNGISESFTLTIEEWYALAVESIEVNPNPIVVSATKTLPVTFNVLPFGADNPEVEWEIKDTSIATIDENGVITGVAEGQTTLVVKSKENNEISTEVDITVGQYVESFIEFTDSDELLTTQYEIGSAMPVKFEYHAGTGETVGESIKLKLRYIKSDGGWQVISDISVDLEDYIGTVEGVVETEIPLADIKPITEIASNEFYYLFVQMTTSSGIKKNVGVQPIQIIKGEEKEEEGGEETPPVTSINNQVLTGTTLYPNPASGAFNIRSYENASGAFSIMDINGKLMKQGTFVSNVQNDISDLPAGFYLVQIQVAKGSAVFKLLIE